MKKLQIPIKILSVFTLTFMIAIVLPVMSTEAAALIDIGITGSGYSSGASTSSVNTNTQTNINSNVNTGVNTGVNTNTVNTGAGVTGNAGAAVNTSTHVFSGDESVRVLRRDVETNMKSNSADNANINTQLNANENSVINILPESVSTSADLKMYASSVMQDDENIEEMNFTKDVIELGYKGRGKLLSVFPVVLNLKAIANADGSVIVSYPWYSFLVVKNKANLEAKLNAALKDALSARANASAQAATSMDNAGFSASEAAEIAVRMHAALRDAFNADVSATSSASSTVDKE